VKVPVLIDVLHEKHIERIVGKNNDVTCGNSLTRDSNHNVLDTLNRKTRDISQLPVLVNDPSISEANRQTCGTQPETSRSVSANCNAA